MTNQADSGATQPEIKKSNRGLIIGIAVVVVAALVGGLIWFFTSQSSADDAVAEAALSEPFSVSATSVPHAKILEFVKSELAEDAGIDFNIEVIDTYPEHNRLLSEGETEANFFQHKPYFDAQVEEFGYQLYAFPGVHIEPYAAFSEKIDSITELPDGATISITNDGSNQARALQLLADAGLVTIPESGDVNIYTVENPHDYQFIEADPANQSQALSDVDLGILNGNFFLDAGFTLNDALLVESTDDNPYANFLTSRIDNKDDPRIVKLNDLLHSAEVKQYIETEWPGGDVYPAF